MKIATYNINSIRARLEALDSWARDSRPDVILLQETKCVDEQFPRQALEDLGYNLALSGQKTYNGVAIASKGPLEEITTRLPGDASDEQARYIEACTTLNGQYIRVASIYVPNGSEVGSEKFAYKLAFLNRLSAHVEVFFADDLPTVLGGDYNVAPYPRDVYDPAALEGTVCYHPLEREKIRALLNRGWLDAWRAAHPETTAFSWWDYRAGCWPQNKGMRIDHLLLNPAAADRLGDAGIDSGIRSGDKASDHAPVWCHLHNKPNRL